MAKKRYAVNLIIEYDDDIAVAPDGKKWTPFALFDWDFSSLLSHNHVGVLFDVEATVESVILMRPTPSPHSTYCIQCEGPCVAGCDCNECYIEAEVRAVEDADAN